MAVMTPTRLDDALEMAAANPDAHLLSGGTDFMVEVNFNHRKPVDVISLARIDELRQWSQDRGAGTVLVGAGVVYAEMEKGPLSALLPALAEAARTVGSPRYAPRAHSAATSARAHPPGTGCPFSRRSTPRCTSHRPEARERFRSRHS